METLKRTAKRFLQYEAKLILQKYKPRVIAIVGSVGKTSTRDAIYKVVSKKFFVRKSEKSFTAEIGIPLTVIGYDTNDNSLLGWLMHIAYGLTLIVWRRKYPQWLIIEIDGDKPFDLSKSVKLLEPDFLVMTATGEVPAHIELFTDIEMLLNENRNIVSDLKRDSVVIYNAGDINTSVVAENSEIKRISCGIGGGFQYSGSEPEILYGNSDGREVPVGVSFSVKSETFDHQFKIFGSLGVSTENAFILAIALGKEMGIPDKAIIEALTQFKVLPGRMNILPGIKNTIIVDDSYNSSPVALEQALSVVKSLRCSGRKILCIGDMLELGKYSSDSHRKVAHQIKDFADYVYCVGIRARLIADELLSFGFPEDKVMQTDTASDAGLLLQNYIEEGDLILIKGSQAMRMERIVLEIMRYPQDASKLLVRQEKEWLERE